MTTANMFFADKDFIQERNEQIQALADQLARTKTVFDLATELATYMIKEKERPNVKIAVTQEEFDQITSIFRVKGIRADGAAENRGRPRRKDGE